MYDTWIYVLFRFVGAEFFFFLITFNSRRILMETCTLNPTKQSSYLNFISALHINVNFAIIDGSISQHALNLCVQKAQLRTMQMDDNMKELNELSIQRRKLHNY